MKRRLDESEAKRDPGVAAVTGPTASPRAALSDDMKLMVAELVAKELLQNLTANASVGSSSSRFGNVGFEAKEEQNVNAFLHQKLGKNHLTRRPGPGGTRLTYIESCKAIELANLAFGFNGWSCHVLECKEEYRIQKGDRWHLGYGSLVRIELKDGASHEDFGFGQSDGQRDLGAAIEQAKKASISDARKRALRLFGEYLGNSCYDREHIKEVHSNRAPVSTNAESPAEMGGRATGAAAVSASGVPTLLAAASPTPAANGQQSISVPHMQPSRAQSIPNGQSPQTMSNGQTPPRAAFNVPGSTVPPRHANGPQGSSPYAPVHGNAADTAPASAAASISSVASRISALQAAEMNKRQAVSTVNGSPGHVPQHHHQQQQQQQLQQRAYQPNTPMQNHPPPASATAPVGQQQQQQRAYQPPAGMPNHAPPAAANAPSSFGVPQYPPRQPLHTLGINAPPPTRMGVYPPTHQQQQQQQNSPHIKAEVPPRAPAVGSGSGGSASEYDIHDLSLSQFDYDPQRS